MSPVRHDPVAEPSGISAIMAVLLCVMPAVATVLFGAVDHTTWILLTLLAVALAMLWLVESWRRGGFPIGPSPLLLPLAGLVLIALIQLTPVAATRSLDPYSTRFFLTRGGVLLVFFAAAVTFVDTERRLSRTGFFIVVFGALMAFYGILQKLSNFEGIYGVREVAQAVPFGPFVNQHHFAAFMQMTGGVTMALLFVKTLGREVRMMLATALIIMGAAVVSTGSRGGLLSFVVVLGVVTLMSIIFGSGERRDSALGSRALAIAGAAALLIAIFGLALFLGANDSLLRGIGVAPPDVDISTGRFHFWPIAIRIFLDHPILGAGYDAFGVAFTRYDTWNGYFRVEQAHNDYLQILADTGLAGFACVTGFIGLLLRKGLGTIAASRGLRQSLAIGALGGCIGIMVHSFFDFPLRTHSNAFFFLLLAVIATVRVGTGGSLNAR